MDFESTAVAFTRQFGSRPTVVAAAPGRVNLIGEHVDYNAGRVLPFAIAQRTVAAAGYDDGGKINLYSHALGLEAEFPVEVAEPGGASSWHNYIRGMVVGLRERGARIEGARIWIGGDLPPGSGMSSSAALCVSTGMALVKLANFDISPLDMALIAQKSEHDFAGTPCGIMDQFASCFGREDQAILLDCRALTHEYVSFKPTGVAILAIPSGVRHDLAEGAYNRRVRSCRKAIEAIAVSSPGTKSLRDVTPEMLIDSKARMDEETFKRARHVVTELTRVSAAAESLRTGDLNALGNLLWETQDSLRDDYEVSCDEIDQLIALLRGHEGVLGARMVGGGFGGVVLAIVSDSAAAAVSRMLETEYFVPAQIEERPFRLRPSSGASAHCLEA